MNRSWLIIPEYERLEESAALAEEYGAAFEYNDFFDPAVYENPQEIQRRIAAYKSLDRDRSCDTMHGAFLDVLFVSRDPVIRQRSRALVEQSFEIAGQLGVRGVVFHTGLLTGLIKSEPYINPWLREAEAFWRQMAKKYSSLDIFMENTFEDSPDVLLRLKESLSDCSNFRLCLDYGHACLTPTPMEDWVKQMAPRTGHMHLNDNDLIADCHWVPGDGEIDWKNCSRLLEKYGLRCPVLLELGGIENQRRALEYMREVGV